MRIALIIERMETARGGLETSTAQIAAELARRGHEVTILCRRGRPPADGIEVVELPAAGWTREARFESFARQAAEAVRAGGCDVAHAMLPVPGADVYQPRGGTVPGQADALARRWGLLAPIRGAFARKLNGSRRLQGELERELVADERVRCLAVSGMIADEFARHLGRDDARVVLNGVAAPDPDSEKRADDRQRLRYRLGVRAGDPVFVTIATNFELKGVYHAIAAFARWLHGQGGLRSGRMVVVGRHNPEGYRRAAGMREIGRQVVFVPPTPDPWPWYAAADACVLLSWYDPCSRVVLEALRWSIPSITTAYNGAAEVLADGAGIVVASPKRVAAVAAATDELADPDRRAAAAAACRQAAPRVSIEAHVDGLLEAYRSLPSRAK